MFAVGQSPHVSTEKTCTFATPSMERYAVHFSSHSRPSFSLKFNRPSLLANGNQIMSSLSLNGPFTPASPFFFPCTTVDFLSLRLTLCFFLPFRCGPRGRLKGKKESCTDSELDPQSVGDQKTNDGNDRNDGKKWHSARTSHITE